MDIGNIIVYEKTVHNYENISKDVEKGADTSNYELEREKQKIYLLNVTRIKWKRMKEFFGLRAKTYNYLADDSDEKKGKATKEWIITRTFEFEDYKNCL